MTDAVTTSAGAGLTDLERTVLDAVDVDDLVALTSELVALPTLMGEEVAGQHRIAELLAERGMDVDTWEVDVAALSEHPQYSAEVDRGTTLGVLASVGASDGGGHLLVDGHVDVVPTGDLGLWSSPPFQASVRDGRLYGRGACDMKGGLAAAIHAADVLGRLGVELPGRFSIAPVVGEEDGGCGTLALLEHLRHVGVRPDGCLIPEPTDGAVVPAVAGALSWRIRIRGRSAHGCLREEGVSAIEKLVPVQEAVLELEAERNVDGGAGVTGGDRLFSWLERPFAICGGRVRGGDWASSEADWLTWEGRYGVAPGEDLDGARSDFEAAVASVCEDDPWFAEHPPTVEWWGGQFLPARTDTDDPLVVATSGAARAVAGERAALRGMPYGCDMGLTVGVAGIPTVVCGPGDIRQAHVPDESVPIDDLVASARTIALAALRFCGAPHGD